MKNQLLLGATLLTAAPGIAMFVLGTNSIIQLLGVATIFLAGLIVPFGFLTQGGVTKFAWLVFAFVLLVLIIASGYIPVAASYTLGFTRNLISIVALCIVAVEVGIVVSMMFGNYKIYAKDLKKAGYDEKEFETELYSFNRFIVLLILASIGASLGAYFLFAVLPSVGIDTLSALVISAIIYFVIARYVLSQRGKGKQQQNQVLKKS
jgi:hypothetical protein